MTDLFLSVLNRSISAGWLILAVLAARLLLKGSPKWIPVLLWGIVALRLISPVSIESGLSLIPSRETVSPEIMLDWSPQIDTGVPLLNEVLNPAITESFTPNPAASANPLQILIPAAAILWLTGMGVMLLYTVVSYVLLRRKVAAAVRLRYNIFQSEFVTTPFVLGILKPKIYLPYTLSKESLIHVISHEKAHIRRKDHWWKPLGLLLLTVHWFNPLMWLSYRLFARDLELACDENVIQNMNSAQRADYAEALLSCSVKPRLVSACPIAFGEVGVKARIRSVMNYRKPAFWIVLLALIACALVALCFLTNPKTETAPMETFAPTEASEPSETDAEETTAPSAPVHQEVADLAWFLELSAFEKEFQEMTPGRKAAILSEYGSLLDGFDLIARETADGALAYIVGCWGGAVEESPLYSMGCAFKGDETGEAMVLYDLRELEAADKYEEPEYLYTIRNSHMNSSSTTGLFLIHPIDSGWGFNEVFNNYLRPNGRAYMLDAFSRGISLGDPEGAYLEVSLISPQWGEIYEKIPLTQEQAAQILSEPRQKLEEGYGFSAVLSLGPNSAINMEAEAGWFTESSGVPQTVLDLAEEKCCCQFAAPDDIQSPIVEAQLDCGWLDGPIYAEEEDLPQLESILKHAEFGYIGKCGYNAKLTIRMEDGSEMVLFKGSDSCDTIAFGSYGGYFLGDSQNVTFWQLFGLDPNTKQPL